MTLNEKCLNKWSNSTFTPITPEQKRIILDRFGHEPIPYEWTEHDIFAQIQNYLSSGEFVKYIHDNGNSSVLPLGVDF